MAKRKPTGGRLLRRRRMRRKSLKADCEWFSKWLGVSKLDSISALQNYYTLSTLFPVKP